jgi:hypothetical protein
MVTYLDILQGFLSSSGRTRGVEAYHTSSSIAGGGILRTELRILEGYLNETYVWTPMIIISSWTSGTYKICGRKERYTYDMLVYYLPSGRPNDENRSNLEGSLVHATEPGQATPLFNSRTRLSDPANSLRCATFSSASRDPKVSSPQTGRTTHHAPGNTEPQRWNCPSRRRTESLESDTKNTNGTLSFQALFYPLATLFIKDISPL